MKKLSKKKLVFITICLFLIVSVIFAFYIKGAYALTAVGGDVTVHVNPASSEGSSITRKFRGNVTYTYNGTYSDTQARLTINTVYFEVRSGSANSCKFKGRYKINSGSWSADTKWSTQLGSGDKFSLGSPNTVVTFNKSTVATTQTATVYVECRNNSSDWTSENRISTVTISAAVPAITQYTVTYDANGGTGGQETTSVFSGYTHTVGSGPTKPGYRFTGWLRGSGGTYQPSNTFTVSSNETMTAQWEPITYNIRFDANGGSGSMDELSMTYEVSKNLTANSFTRSTFNFASWNTKADGSGTSYSNNESVKNLTTIDGGTVDLYAQWTQKPAHTVTANANGGTIPQTSSWTVNSTTATKSVSEDLQYGTLPTPTRTGFTFVGWYTESSGGTEVTSSTIVTNSSDHTIYAHWQVNPLTFGNQNISVNYSTSAQTKNVTTATNGSGTYTYAKQSGDSAITVSSSGVITIPASKGAGTYNIVIRATDSNSEATKDATYTINIRALYQVKFNSNGGSGNMSNQSFVYEEEQYLTNNTFTRTGYHFIGWNTETDGSGTWYMQGVKYKNLTSTNGAVVNLYAQWFEESVGEITIEGEDAPTDAGGNVFFDNYQTYTVNVVVLNGTVDTSSKEVEYYTNGLFNLTPNTNYGNPTVSCTNSQMGSVTNNVLTVTGLSSNTTCTVTFSNILFTTTLDPHGGSIPNTTGWTTATAYAEHNETVSEEAPETNICCVTTKPTMSTSTGLYTVSGTYVSYSSLASTGYYCNLSDTNSNSGASCSNSADAIAYSASSDDSFSVNYYSVATMSATKAVTYGNEYGTLPIPTKAGNTFDGWYTETTGGTRINADTIVSATANHTLHAHWIQKQYKVLFLNTKTDKTPLMGTTFALTGVDYDDNDVLKTVTSDILGRVVFEVPVGDYEIVETIAYTDYHLNDSILYVTVDDD